MKVRNSPFFCAWMTQKDCEFVVNVLHRIYNAAAFSQAAAERGNAATNLIYLIARNSRNEDRKFRCG